MEETVNHRLREVRDQRECTQAELAAFLCVERATISQWERRGYIPSKHIVPICHYLSCTADYLLGIHQKQKKQQK